MAPAYRIEACTCHGTVRTGGIVLDRIETGQAPILPDRIDEVGRRTDREPGRIEVWLLQASILRPHADRDIQVEPEGEPEPAGSLAAAGKLLIGEPLHEFEESNRIAIDLAKLSKLFIGRISPRLGPFPPRTSVAPAQQLETGKTGQNRTAILSETLERARTLAVAGLAEALVGASARLHLDGGHAGIIDQLALPKMCDLLLERSGAKAGKFRHRIEIDIKRVEKKPAAGRIRACLFDSIIEHDVQ